ncbi:hypothetical protein M514_03771 [Trichuris suis]|uniref:RNA-directed DNA polymerase n=1 Tax=Trichuris suis TaxID=68888 RepID=A0A085MZL4_9BILA|nr:hypothetical protein M514_03771 [Trichuris suis]
MPSSIQLVLKAMRTTGIDDLARSADDLTTGDGSLNAVAAIRTANESTELQELRQEVVAHLLVRRRMSAISIRSLVAARGVAGPHAIFRETDIPGTRGVDTGSEVSVLPPRLCTRKHRRQPDPICLLAANGAQITTYGTCRLTVDFGIGRPLEWTFTIADVRHPILGADFFRCFNLLVDVKRAQLINAKTYAVTNSSPLQTKSEHYACALRRKNNHTDNVLARYPDLTACTTNDEPIRHTVKHRILTFGPPIFSRPRRLPPETLRAAKHEFNNMLRMGVIQPSSSWASPLHMVPKNQVGIWRPCGDYHRLNNVTKPDRYPVPHGNDFSSLLFGRRMFSKIHLVRAYQQIPVHPKDVHKTAITTPFGLYEYKRMPFGLRNSAQTFQRFMDQVTRDLDFCFVYLDDVLVASKTAREHDAHLADLFDRFLKYGVKLNPAKCVFRASSLEFLGFHLSADGIPPLQQKVAAIERFPTPSNINELRRFLGCINFNRRFIPGAAVLLAPLERLISSKPGRQAIRLSPEAVESFERSKQALADATLLCHPAENANLSLVVDASDEADGAVLQQKENGHWAPLSFFSRRFRPRESKYSAFGRELLAAYWAVRHIHYLLEGRQFAIVTDHKPLVQAVHRGSGMHNSREVRQLDYITSFTSDVRHIKGNRNAVADALSRISVDSLSVQVDSAKLAQLANAQSTDEELRRLRDSSTSLHLQKVEVPNSAPPIWCDVWHGKIRPFLPAPLRRDVFNTLHSLSHPGIRATRRLITEHYVWPSMNRDTGDWTRTCDLCQRTKVQRHTRAPPTTFEVPERRFDYVHLDIVGPLPQCRGCSYLLTMVDRFTRWPEVIPVPNACAATIAHAFMSTWVARFSVPAVITTDQGGQFQSSLWKELASFLGMKLAPTTAYHPQTNGLVERLHRQLKGALTAHVLSSRSWFKALPLVLLGLRCVVKEGLQHSLAELVYGSPLRLPGVFFSGTAPRSVAEHSDELKIFFDSVLPTPTRGGKFNKWFVPKQLETCTHVYLRHDASHPPLSPTYDGPYRIPTRTKKTVTILYGDRLKTVSIDRVKPAFIDPTHRTLERHVQFSPSIEFIP